jgi:hypothetical protein
MLVRPAHWLPPALDKLSCMWHLHVPFPSLFQELNEDLGLPTPKHGDLSSWTEQGEEEGVARHTSLSGLS